jgi:hypothetical protein
MNEKSILEMCDHPFLLTLAASYQVRLWVRVRVRARVGVRARARATVWF